MPGGLDPVEIAPHLIPAGGVSGARQRRAGPVVDTANEERLAVLGEARPAHVEAAGQRLVRQAGGRSRRRPAVAAVEQEARRQRRRRPARSPGGSAESVRRGTSASATSAGFVARANAPFKRRLRPRAAPRHAGPSWADPRRILGLFAFPFLSPSRWACAARRVRTRRRRPRRSARRHLRRLARRVQGRRPQARRLQGDRVSDGRLRPDLRLRRPRQDRSRLRPRRRRAGRRDRRRRSADGFLVVVKPHLDPPAYQPGFDQFQSENGSWRVACPWRGFFDLDPMSAAYREGVVFGALRMLKEVLGKPGAAAAPAGSPRAGSRADELRRLRPGEVGAAPGSGQEGAPPAGPRRQGASSRTTSPTTWRSPTTSSARMTAERAGRAPPLHPRPRRALAVAVHGSDRRRPGRRTRQAAADRRRDLRRAGAGREELSATTSWGGRWACGGKEIPPLHIGEFGVGRGGLKHPNLWAGEATPAQEKELAHEIALGHAGPARLPGPPRRTHRRRRHPVGHRPPLRHLRLGEPELRQPRGHAAIKAALGR